MLQFISHFNEKYDYLESIKLALKGGCKWIQLRIKDSDIKDSCLKAMDEYIENIALSAMKLCREAGATFIIDDRIDLVKKIGADGVHLGLNDMPIDEARKILGPDFIIGGTANTFEHIKMHYERGANYLGIGPFRHTTTKKNISTILGLEGYEKLMAQMKEAGINIPVVAIGGINYEDIESLMKTGITGIAVSGTILNAEDPVKECSRILEIL